MTSNRRTYLSSLGFRLKNHGSYSRLNTAAALWFGGQRTWTRSNEGVGNQEVMSVKGRMGGEMSTLKKLKPNSTQLRCCLRQHTDGAASWCKIGADFSMFRSSPFTVIRYNCNLYNTWWSIRNSKTKLGRTYIIIIICCTFIERFTSKILLDVYVVYHHTHA